MNAAIKAAFRVRRFEILSLLALTGGAAVSALVIASMLGGLPQPPDCYVDGAPQNADCAAPQAFIELSQGLAGTVTAAIAILPFVIGSVLGVTIVGREIEHRTASFTWSLQPARVRWLLESVFVLGVLMAALIVPLIASSVVLQGARYPGIDPSASFFDYGGQGPILMVRAAGAFGVALAAGAVLGRVLPALLVASVACAALFVTLPTIGTLGRSLEPITEQDVSRGALFSGTGYRTDDGALLGPQEAYARAPVGMGPAEQAEWVEARFTYVRLGLAGDQLASVQTQEAAIVVLLTTVFVFASAVVVQRRRPY